MQDEGPLKALPLCEQVLGEIIDGRLGAVDAWEGMGDRQTERGREIVCIVIELSIVQHIGYVRIGTPWSSCICT